MVKIEMKNKKFMFAIAAVFLIAGSTAAGFMDLPQSLAAQAQLMQIQTSPGPFIAQGIELGILALLITISVAALVYVLSGWTGSPNAKAWSRMQIYQALVTGLVLAVFVGLFALVLTNPQGIMQPLGVVPNWQAQFGEAGTSSGATYNCANTPDIFQLATCDLSLFASDAFYYFDALFLGTMIAGADGGISVQINPLSAVSSKVMLPDVTIGFSQESLFPISIEDGASWLFSAIMFFMIFVNVLLFLVAGAPFWLVFFIVLGLLARAFGVTRTFGGAMIALGVGLGIILPLIISMTYGYLDVQIQQISLTTLIGQILNMMLWAASLIFSTGTFVPQTIFQLAAIVAGLTFIPFLSLTVLDAFIVDFSKAIGERLDFMSLLTGLV